jgi:hypothetical protein
MLFLMLTSGTLGTVNPEEAVRYQSALVHLTQVNDSGVVLHSALSVHAHVIIDVQAIVNCLVDGSVP